ncbi:MAG TPA: hypothetical protein VMN03_00135 [Burkholderiales bacterium]|nr:hypothetical protein [Burkholderiales bacterium]
MAWLITPDTFGVAWDDISEYVHWVLAILGMLPDVFIVPAAFDGADAILYALEGNDEEANWAAMAMVPGLGQGARATHLGMKISRKAALKLGRKGLTKALIDARYKEARHLWRDLQPNRRVIGRARRMGLKWEKAAIERYYAPHEKALIRNRRLKELLRDLDPRDGRTPKIYRTDLIPEAQHIIEKRILHFPQYRKALQKFGWDKPGKMPTIPLSEEFHRRSPRSLGSGRSPLMPLTEENKPNVTSLTWLLMKRVDPAQYKNFPELMRAYEKALKATDPRALADPRKRKLVEQAWRQVEPLFDYINRVIKYR